MELQDMRVAETDAVLFDYGRTLVTFQYPTDELVAVVEHYRPAITEATGVTAPSSDDLLRRVLLPLEEFVQAPAIDEVDYLEVFGAAWRRAGLDLPPPLLYQILDAEQQVWDRAARVDAMGLVVLDTLHARGLKRGVCSNAPFPPEMMLRQLEGNGIAEHVDGAVFSSQVGRRKPAPEIYMAALEAVGAEAGRTLFVGDRVREDYEGPREVGMRAVICTTHAEVMPGDGVATIGSLEEVLNLL